jgi:hypothetical protein
MRCGVASSRAHHKSRELDEDGQDVSWSLAVAVKPGQLDEFKAVAAEMIESTRAEPRRAEL